MPLWKKLVRIYHPDRFAGELEKHETYEKLTSAINRAKDNRDISTLREIADDPHGFILRQGWTWLDFTEEEEIGQLRRLFETLQLQIISILDALNELQATPDFEPYQLSEVTPAVVDDVVTEKSELLKKETAVLETEAAKLAREIEELTGQRFPRVAGSI